MRYTVVRDIYILPLFIKIIRMLSKEYFPIAVSMLVQLLFMNSSYAGGDRTVPLISISINTDPKNYLSRLIRSIDYPVEYLHIQIGNTDTTVIDDILRKIGPVESNNSYILRCNHTIINYNPGSSRGFNFGFDKMNSMGKSWALVMNYDIAFYPGVLRRIARSTEYHLKHDSGFGIGFTSLCCGGYFSALVLTNRLLKVVGYFDENFYPAYYEDDDYSVRVHLSELHARQFNNTPLIHGEVDGSKAYISGLVDLLFYHPPKTREIDIWRNSFQIGVKRAGEYFNEKWGSNTAKLLNAKESVPCKTAQGINQYCNGTYRHPFNNPLFNISYWTMRPEVLAHIDSAKTIK